LCLCRRCGDVVVWRFIIRRNLDRDVLLLLKAIKYISTPLRPFFFAPRTI
jgi:hypothetical protein